VSGLHPQPLGCSIPDRLCFGRRRGTRTVRHSASTPAELRGFDHPAVGEGGIPRVDHAVVLLGDVLATVLHQQGPTVDNSRVARRDLSLSRCVDKRAGAELRCEGHQLAAIGAGDVVKR
jgi:hypothetical protein